MVDVHKRNKRIKSDCITRVIVFGIFLVFICLHLGARDYEHHGITQMFSESTYFYDKGDYSIFVTIGDAMDSILTRPLDIYPFRPIYLLIALFGTGIFALFQMEYYRMHKNMMPDVEHGSGDFQTNYMEYNRKFVYDPKLCHPSRFSMLITAPVRMLGRMLGGTTVTDKERIAESKKNAAPSEIEEEKEDGTAGIYLADIESIGKED